MGTIDKFASKDTLVLNMVATLWNLLAAGRPLEEAKGRVMELKPHAAERLVEAGTRL